LGEQVITLGEPRETWVNFTLAMELSCHGLL
jgi:hypothetical protein